MNYSISIHKYRFAAWCACTASRASKKCRFKVTVGSQPTDHEYIEENASFWYFEDGFKENAKKEIKNAYEEDGDNGIMELGWFPVEQEVIFLGPLNVTKV